MIVPELRKPHLSKPRLTLRLLAVLCLCTASRHPALAGPRYEGKFFSGQGDAEYLQLLDIARRLFAPDPEFQNMAMLYSPEWNGLTEGPTWGAWWIQNSYGTTYCALPFYQEPFVTFLKNANDLWFDQMGDGHTVRPVSLSGKRYEWIPPDGCLCDAARPGWFVAKQGDGEVDIHDWGMEFTAAGLLMQAELLLINRDAKQIQRYLPKLERCAKFIESRRDPKNNLFLAGPAGNLLAPSYAGFKKPDGTYDMAYLTGLSVTYIAALDRLIELERLAGNSNMAKLYAERRDAAREGLATLTTADGYLIRSLDPDGTRHGVFGAEKHGYFEASPNHDAICFRVVDDAQAARIYAKLASIPGLRPHDLIIPNYPSYDDMYNEPAGLWSFGRWVNGGHWSTCEARMVMSYYRLGKFEDARRSMQQIMTFARRWRMDAPLINFGGDVYQPDQPINLCYDAFGAPAALIRGLFEYLYRSDSLTLIPHIPPNITELEQRFPIRFGKKRLYLSTAGSGPITAVWVNEKPWSTFDSKSITLAEANTPNIAYIRIALGGAKLTTRPATQPAETQPESQPATSPAPSTRQIERFLKLARARGLGEGYEVAHAELIVACIAALHERQNLLARGKLPALAEPARSAADKSYADTITRLMEGLDKTIKSYRQSDDPRQKIIFQIWPEDK